MWASRHVIAYTPLVVPTAVRIPQGQSQCPRCLVQSRRSRLKSRGVFMTSWRSGLPQPMVLTQRGNPSFSSTHAPPFAFVTWLPGSCGSQKCTKKALQAVLRLRRDKPHLQLVKHLVHRRDKRHQIVKRVDMSVPQRDPKPGVRVQERREGENS